MLRKFFTLDEIEKVLPQVFWIDAPMLGRIAVMPRPRPQAFGVLKAQGVDVIVSLLEHEEASRVGLADEHELCRAAGMGFLHLPVVDHGVPKSVDAVRTKSQEIAAQLKSGKGVAVHCFAGLGRSPLLIAAVMVDYGMDARDSFDRISAARGVRVPEMSAQADWLLDYERIRRGWN